MKITPLIYGRSELSEWMIFRGGSKDRSFPIDFILYLIETENRKILVDAGCVTMPGFVMRDFCGPVTALRAYGVEPTEITDLLITHAHHDHIECVSSYPNATVVIQSDEYENAKKKNYIPANTVVKLFEEKIQITNGVEMRKIGGHSRGSCVVHIYDDSHEYVIVGDECYKRACVEQGIPTGSSYCPEKSEAFIRTYCDPQYTLLYSHDA